MIHPPQSAEDGYSWSGDREYEWRQIFPEPQNAKCAAYKKQLETDLVELGEVVNERCNVELLVSVGGEWEKLVGDCEAGEEGVLREWLVDLARKWRDMGKNLTVKTVGADFVSRELRLL